MEDNILNEHPPQTEEEIGVYYSQQEDKQEEDNLQQEDQEEDSLQQEDNTK